MSDEKRDGDELEEPWALLLGPEVLGPELEIIRACNSVTKAILAHPFVKGGEIDAEAQLRHYASVAGTLSMAAAAAIVLTGVPPLPAPEDPEPELEQPQTTADPGRSHLN